jgi:predicted NBD/HSP70 family sugar kinase
MTQDRIRSLVGGINQSGVRAHNERLLLSTLQRHGAMGGSEIARRTGLSPQTASVILRKLEADGLVARGQSVKGKVGKPSVPMRIRPDGLFSYGVKLGRRSADLLLMDFGGAVRAQRLLRYPYPRPDEVLAFLGEGMRDIESGMEADATARICGVGLAMPFELWSWHEQVGAPARDLSVWKRIDMAAEITALCRLPVFVVNDATAACRAEHMFGRGRVYKDYAYVFMGAFIGGGVVLNHAVFEGSHGNAGAFGPLRVCAPDGARLLLDIASIHTLERRLARAGVDPVCLWQMPQDWSSVAAFVDPWLDDAARALAEASLAACAVIDVEAVVVDGAIPVAIRDRLVTRMRDEIARLDTRGLILPEIGAGLVGANARAIGAAAGPVLAQYLLNSGVGLGDPL